MIKDLGGSGREVSSGKQVRPPPPCFSEVFKNKALISSRVEVIERKEVRDGSGDEQEFRRFPLGGLQVELASVPWRSK